MSGEDGSRVCVVELELGRQVVDLATHALVMAPVPAAEDWVRLAEERLEQGADALCVMGPGDEIPSIVGACLGRFSVPVAVSHTDTVTAGACLDAGAWALEVAVPVDPELLSVIAQAEATVILGLGSVEAAEAAQAAGVAASRIILEAPIEAMSDVVALGYPTLVTVPDAPQMHGTTVAAVMAGARIIRSARVQSTKRICFTISELLARRGVAAPAAVRSVLAGAS